MKDPTLRNAASIVRLCVVLAALVKMTAPVGNVAASQIDLPRVEKPTQGEWGHQGNGTYANPVMPGDFSDLNAIRIGDDLYAVSSSLQY